MLRPARLALLLVLASATLPGQADQHDPASPLLEILEAQDHSFDMPFVMELEANSQNSTAFTDLITRGALTPYTTVCRNDPQTRLLKCSADPGIAEGTQFDFDVNLSNVNPLASILFSTTDFANNGIALTCSHDLESTAVCILPPTPFSNQQPPFTYPVAELPPFSLEFHDLPTAADAGIEPLSPFRATCAYSAQKDTACLPVFSGNNVQILQDVGDLSLTGQLDLSAQYLSLAHITPGNAFQAVCSYGLNGQPVCRALAEEGISSGERDSEAEMSVISSDVSPDRFRVVTAELLPAFSTVCETLDISRPDCQSLFRDQVRQDQQTYLYTVLTDPRYSGYTQTLPQALLTNPEASADAQTLASILADSRYSNYVEGLEQTLPNTALLPMPPRERVPVKWFRVLP